MAAIQQYGKAAANVLASATRNGLLAAADYLRVKVARFYGSQTFLGGQAGTHLAVNADIDEATGVYNRQDTASKGALWQFYTDSAFVSFAPAGANPLSFSTGTFQLAEVPTTDANGWARVFQTNGKRRWSKRTTVGSGWPASQDWNIATENLPVGISNVGQVRVKVQPTASTQTEKITGGVVATTATTNLPVWLRHVTANWNTVNPTVLLDFELTEM